MRRMPAHQPLQAERTHRSVRGRRKVVRSPPAVLLHGYRFRDNATPPAAYRRPSPQGGAIVSLFRAPSLLLVLQVRDGISPLSAARFSPAPVGLNNLPNTFGPQDSRDRARQSPTTAQAASRRPTHHEKRPLVLSLPRDGRSAAHGAGRTLLIQWSPSSFG